MIPFPEKKYNIIYADPPWHYGSKSIINGKNEFGTNPLSVHYPTMKLKELEELKVKDLTLEDAICFMWVTDSHLDEGLSVLKSWGFKYKTIAFNWIKKTSKGNFCKNPAPWTLKSSEICLLGTKGKMMKYKKLHNIQSLIITEREKHSQKPQEARDRIQLMFGDIPKIELFARTKTEGWDAWGNEI